MAGKSTISITFKLDGDAKGFKDLTKGADGLKKALGGALSEAQKLNSRSINFAALAAGIDSASASIQQLHAQMKDLADAYAIQEIAERELETVMRQRMKATDEEIQSIKDFASAQQELGVIGDEVQLSGAQQLSTFLWQTDALKELIPAMNNLIAQQKGLTATNQDAVTIANLMGKALMGQTGALRRVGISFDENQEKVMKNGNEMQRAAMLAEIITDNVGNMNAELAKTDSGKQKQLENTLGDIKELIGSWVQPALPFVTLTANAAITLAALTKLGAGIRSLGAVIVSWNLKAKGAALATLLMGQKAKNASAMFRVFSAALKGTAYQATATKIAIKGLMVATGVGAAIVALTTAIEALTGASDDAAEKEKEFAAQLEERKKAMTDISQATAENCQQEIAALDALYKVASDETKSRDERTAAILRMQSQYPAYFSNLNAESINVNSLKNDYDNLRSSIIAAARAKAAGKKIEENVGHQLDLEEQIRQVDSQIKEGAEKYISAKTNANIVRNKSLDDSKKPTPLKDLAAGSTLQLGGTRDSQLYQNLKAADDNVSQALDTLNALKSKRSQLVQEYIGYDDANDKLAKIVAEGNKSGKKATGGGGVPIKGSAVRGGGASAKSPERKLVYREDAENLKDIGENIEILNAKLQIATVEEAAEINKQIAKWQEKADTIRNAGKIVEEAPKEEIKFKDDAENLQDIGNNIDILNDKLQTASIDEASAINNEIKLWEAKADAIRNAGIEAEKEHISAMKAFTDSWGATKSMQGAIQGITDSINGEGSAWTKLCAIIDGFIGLYEGINTIVGIINMMTAASQAHTAAKGAEAVVEGTAAGARTAAATTTATSAATVVTANKLETAAYKELAAAEYMAAHAYIPFAGFAIGAGFTAAMQALVTAAGVPMLAEGGIAGGPTLAMVGEYPGAANNPEVIAPLDKLKGMFKDTTGFNGGEVEFKIKGRTLVGILSKENNLIKRN